MTTSELTTARQQALQVIGRLEANPERLRQNWSLPTEAARFVSLLTRIHQARRVLEVGTSIGYSALYFGLALLETDGRLDTIDASAERQAEARTNFEAAGIQDRISLLEGDALTTLNALCEQGAVYDLIFLDARKSEYLDYLHLAERLLKPGGVLLADNTQSHRADMQPFVDAVLSSSRWDACDIETTNGMILARFVPERA